MTIYSTRDYVHSVINVPSRSHAAKNQIDQKLISQHFFSAWDQVLSSQQDPILWTSPFEQHSCLNKNWLNTQPNPRPNPKTNPKTNLPIWCIKCKTWSSFFIVATSFILSSSRTGWFWMETFLLVIPVTPECMILDIPWFRSKNMCSC